MTITAKDPFRHVLSADAPLLANLAALWTVDPALAAEIESSHKQPSYELRPSRAGAPTVSVPTADGRTVCLHSRYQPLDEAARLVDGVKVADRTAFYVFGLGLGYHLERLFDRAGSEAIFCVFEPDLLLLRTAFEARDLSRLVESRRVMFFTRLHKGELLARLTPHAALISVGAEQIVHPPSMEAAGPFHRQMQAWLEEFASFSRTSLNTVVHNSARTAENIARNLAWYVASPGVSRLAARHRGEPAVIISAGPSLRKNKHLLPGLKGRAVLIAVQTTLQPLLDMGVEPDYVTSLDYHDICTRFFEKLPRHIGTELVAEPKASSAIFRMYPGRVSILGNRFAELLVREMNLAKTELTGGATVAHLAFYLAEYMGCDPIIFVGQDLGFSDGLIYVPGTGHEAAWRPELGRFCTIEMKQWEQIVRERFVLRQVPDYRGRPMYTEERLFTYLQQFERDFLRSKSKVIDATEGGVAKRGSTAMKLSEAVERFCRLPLRPAHDDYPAPRWGRAAECVELLERRRREAAQVERISRQTLPLLEEIRLHIEDQPRVNRAIGEVDGLRVRMNEFGPTYDLITELTQSTQLKRFEEDRKISAGKLSGLEKQRRQVARDIENVQGVMQASAEFQNLMDRVIGQIASEIPQLVRREAA